MTGPIEFPRRNSLMYLCSYVKKRIEIPRRYALSE